MHIRLQDLERFDKVPGKFIANLKVSKVGGVRRGLALIQALRKRGWPIIHFEKPHERTEHILAFIKKT